MRLSNDVVRFMLEHAEQESPRECCGLLVGRNDFIDTVYSLPNTSDQPEKRYFADPEALLSAFKEIQQSDKEHLGIYHSHPFSKPQPSPADIDQAYYSSCVYFIVGPDWMVPRLRAFRLLDGAFEPTPFVVVDE